MIEMVVELIVKSIFEHYKSSLWQLPLLILSTLKKTTLAHLKV
jgi:hypothetical protein